MYGLISVFSEQEAPFDQIEQGFAFAPIKRPPE
jgi:hypothetical protein